MEDDLFDNGIDGEPFEGPGDDYYEEEEDYREDFDIHNANGLEIKGWPTYGNCTVITNMYHMYVWFSGKIEVIELKSGSKYANIGDPHVLTLPGDLYFFGEKTTQREDGRWNIEYYTGEQVNKKIQRYLNLKAFL